MAVVGKEYIMGDVLYDLISQMLEDLLQGFSFDGKLYLGGSEGPDGGDYHPNRPFVGQLPQRKVAYDTTERSTPENFGITRSGWINSLLDNLNHMRYWMLPARWFEPRFNNTFTATVGSGVWWRGQGTYIDFDGDQITVTNPDATNPRIDVLYINNAGSLAVNAGTPASSPSASYPGVSHLPVCEIWVKPSGTPGITVSGIGYAYQSGYAQAYLYEDVRPYFGVNYDIDIGGIEYLADLLDVTITSPQDRDVLTYDSGGGIWVNNPWMHGGIGGGQPTLQVDGPLATLSGVGGAYIFTRSGEINKVYMYCEYPGTSGYTTVDVNINGTSIFTNPADRPSLFWNDVNKVQATITLSGVNYQEEDLLTIDTDGVAIDSSNMTVVVATDSSNDHPHSNGPHTGVLYLDELQDGVVSGYPLLSNGNGLSGGPEYGQLPTVGLQNDAVSYAKVGGGGLKTPYRQGGDANDWTTGGTNNYDISDTDIKTQYGAVTTTVPGNTGSDPNKHKQTVTVTFPEAFSQIPQVYLQVNIGNIDSWNFMYGATAALKSVSTTQFTYYVGFDIAEDRAVTVYWTAVGEE